MSTILIKGILTSVLYVHCSVAVGSVDEQDKGKEAEATMMETARRYNFSIDPKERDDIITRHFDIAKPEVSKFMVRLMNMRSYMGRKSMISQVAREILLRKKDEGLRWLLDHFDEFSAIGRENMTGCVKQFECRESYRLLCIFLNDMTEYVVGNGEGGHRTQRICDAVFNDLRSRCYEAILGDLRKEVRTRINLVTPGSVESRNQKIQRLQTWLASADGKRFLNDKKSITSLPDSESAKEIEKGLNALEEKIAKGQPPKDPAVNPEEEESEDYKVPEDNPKTSPQDKKSPAKPGE